jgi:choline dehydrogenase-like flavoprotein
MGADPKKSVLNSYNQAHDVPNLFVIDGSSFVSGGVQNPTLTILALTMRASEYLIGKRRRGEV